MSLHYCTLSIIAPNRVEALIFNGCKLRDENRGTGGDGAHDSRGFAIVVVKEATDGGADGAGDGDDGGGDAEDGSDVVHRASLDGQVQVDHSQP